MVSLKFNFLERNVHGDLRKEILLEGRRMPKPESQEAVKADKGILNSIVEFHTQAETFREAALHSRRIPFLRLGPKHESLIFSTFCYSFVTYVTLIQMWQKQTVVTLERQYGIPAVFN